VYVVARTLAVWFASGCTDPLPASGDPELYREKSIARCEERPGLFPLICPVTSACDPRANAPDRVRIVSWNIKAGLQSGLAAVAATLRELHPDVVLLQEVDRGTQRTQEVDQSRVLAASLGEDFDYVFAPTIRLEGGSYGIATLSSLRVQAASAIVLSNADNAEPRTAIDTTLCMGPSTLRVINHHADYRPAGAANSCREILDNILASAPGPTVFAGDLNQQPSDPGPAAYVQAGLQDVLALHDPASTFGDRRIDYIFLDEGLAAQVIDAEVVNTDASDHALIMMDLATR
jgi:alpha-N-acetylglucosaminidase